MCPVLVSKAADLVAALGEKVAQVHFPLDLPNMAFQGQEGLLVIMTHEAEMHLGIKYSSLTEGRTIKSSISQGVPSSGVQMAPESDSRISTLTYILKSCQKIINIISLHH